MHLNPLLPPRKSRILEVYFTKDEDSATVPETVWWQEGEDCHPQWLGLWIWAECGVNSEETKITVKILPWPAEAEKGTTDEISALCITFDICPKWRLWKYFIKYTNKHVHGKGFSVLFRRNIDKTSYKQWHNTFAQKVFLIFYGKRKKITGLVSNFGISMKL